MKAPAILAALLLAPLLPGQSIPPPAMDRERASSEATVLALSTEKDQLESMLRSLLKASGEDLLQTAADIQLPDNVVKKLYPKFTALRSEIDHLKQKGLGKSDPGLMAKEQELQALKGQINEGVVALRDTLQANLEVTEARLKRAKAAPDGAIRKGLEAQDYVDAKRTFEAEQQMLQAMKLKRAEIQSPSEASTVELDRTIRLQEETVDQCRKVLANIVKARGIRYQGPAEADRIQKTDVQPPPAANPLKADKPRLEGQLKFLNDLTGEPLLTFAGNLDLRDNPVAELHRRQLTAVLDLDELKANGLGADHPKVMTKTRMIEALKAQLDTAVGALRETLKAQLTLVNAQLAALDAEKPVPAKPE